MAAIIIYNERRWWSVESVGDAAAHLWEEVKMRRPPLVLGQRHIGGAAMSHTLISVNYETSPSITTNWQLRSMAVPVLAVVSNYRNRLPTTFTYFLRSAPADVCYCSAHVVYFTRRMRVTWLPTQHQQRSVGGSADCETHRAEPAYHLRLCAARYADPPRSTCSTQEVID